MSDDRFESLTAIRDAEGLRMACIRGVPTPWSEAAKGIFHVKGLPLRLGAQSEVDPEQAIQAWYGDSGVPVLLHERETPRTGWAEILLLAERLAPEPALLPADAGQRADVFGLAHEICGEMGFGWSYRLLMVQQSLGHSGPGGFPPQVANLLAAKYGFNPAHVREARGRVVGVLDLLSSRIEGREFLVGEKLTAADIYWAVFANLMLPLPEEDMPAIPMIRAAYTCEDEELLGHVSASLKAHQRRVYDEYLELPVPI